MWNIMTGILQQLCRRVSVGPTGRWSRGWDAIPGFRPLWRTSPWAIFDCSLREQVAADAAIRVLFLLMQAACQSPEKLLAESAVGVDDSGATPQANLSVPKGEENLMRKSFFALVLLLVCPLLVAQQAMNNDAVIKLVKAGLSDDVVVSTINASAGNYDTSANALVALKTAGASDKVISAVVMKASGATPAPAAPQAAASSLPAGIDDEGVYYKDKTGAWTQMMPEIVNFKTGGVLKSIATDGLVKGDLNGHVAGQHAKISLTFPLTIAVYLPEETEITEYQLLRLRVSGHYREFRSVTGGVMHVSGGATRDSVPFQSTKIGHRLYEINLDQTLGKGEYGLLPPGAVGSSNMGSNGKIYSFTIVE